MKKLFTLLILITFFSGVLVAQDDSRETLLEQQKALESEQNPVRHNGTLYPGAFIGVTNPLFVGVDDVTLNAYVGDPSVGNWDSVFTGFEVWGAGYDNINDKIYFNDGAMLYEWPVGGTPAFVDTINDGLGATLTMVSLAGYNGVLYGTRNIANEAVYTIDPSTGIATVFIDYIDADFDFGGLAVDPTTGDVYGTSDDSTPGRGLYLINPDGTATLIVGYPTGQTDIDGLAMSQSQVAYLITDEQDSVYIYDIPGAAWLPAIPTPWTTSEVFCGGTWNVGIIPVEFSSFAASVSGNDVTLNWTTATETNNSGFEVVRRLQGDDYEVVGFVPGFGTTTEIKSYSFVDENLQPGSYAYRLRQIDLDGTSEYSDMIEVDVFAPAEFSLQQNYPNPFNPSTKITFSLAENSKVTLTIFNVLGQEVTSILNTDLAAGEHEVDFNAVGLNSGVYFYKLTAVGSTGEEFTSVKKMILTK